jgi:hypothetical protein
MGGLGHTAGLFWLFNAVDRFFLRSGAVLLAVFDKSLLTPKKTIVNNSTAKIAYLISFLLFCFSASFIY